MEFPAIEILTGIAEELINKYKVSPSILCCTGDHLTAIESFSPGFIIRGIDVKEESSEFKFCTNLILSIFPFAAPRLRNGIYTVLFPAGSRYPKSVPETEDKIRAWEKDGVKDRAGPP
jgi:hypothetical protein